MLKLEFDKPMNMAESERGQDDVTKDSAEIQGDAGEGALLPPNEMVGNYFNDHPVASFTTEDAMRAQGRAAVEAQYNDVLADLAELTRLISNVSARGIDSNSRGMLETRLDTLNDAKRSLFAVRKELGSTFKKQAETERILYARTVAERDRNALYAANDRLNEALAGREDGDGA